MATQNAINVGVVVGGGFTYTFPSATSTLASLALSEAFTNKTYNGLTLTSTTGTFTLTNAKTFAVTNTLTLSGTDSTVMTFPTTTATIARTDAAQTFTGVQTFSSAPVLSTSTITVGGSTNTFQAVADTVVYRATTDTLTNKTMIATTNVVEEITTTASSSTPTPTGGSLRNFFTVTALAANATFAAPSGTPVNDNKLTIRIKDNAAARTLAWNAIYRAGDTALPTTTVISKTMYLGFIYNGADAKWDFVAFIQNF